MDATPAPRTRLAALAAGALLALSLLLAGCPGGEEGGGPGGGPGGGEGPDAPPAAPRDPAVEAALAKRPDLARNRVIVLGMDGADPRLVRELVEADRLPHFKRLMEEGAFGPLRSQQPMLSPLLWTTVATGKWPTEHGVLDFLVRDEADPAKRTTAGSRQRQVEAIWDIAGRYGRKVALVGWLASHPAERVNGWAVSERSEQLAYLYNQPPLPSDEGKTWPPDLMEELRTLRRTPAAVPPGEITPFVDVGEEEYRTLTAKEEFTEFNRVNNLRLIRCAAGNFRRIGLHLWRTKGPDLMCIYFEDLDAVCHNFMAYREPVTWKPRSAEEILGILASAPPPAGRPPLDPEFVASVVAKVSGEMPGEEKVPVPEGQLPWLAEVRELATGANPDLVRKWGRAVDAAYEEADRILGEVMDAMDDRTTLLLLSDHGFESGPGKPPFDSSFMSRAGGAAYHRTNGILGLFGHGVRRGIDFGPEGRKRVEGPPAGPVPTEEDLEGFLAGLGPPPRLLDIAPTVLALLGFPKAKDMPGRVLAEVLDLDLATGEVETYETGRSVRLARERMAREERRRLDGGGGDPTEDAAVEEAMRNLIAVGYVGTAEEGPVRAMMHMAVSYLEQGRLAEAEEAYGEVLKSATGQQRLLALVQLGMIRLRRGDPAGAEARLREALEEKGDCVPALVGLVKILEDRDDRGERPAVTALWERICVLDETPLFRLRLADSLRQGAVRAEPAARDRDLARAVEILAAARPKGGDEGDPEWRKFEAIRRNYLGMVLVDWGRFPEAEAALREAADLDEDYLRPRNNLAVVFMRLSNTDFDEARRAPTRERAEEILRSMTARREEALRWIDRVLAIDPANPKALFNRAEVFSRLPPQDLPAAERELVKALEAAPDYRRAQQLLDAIRAALEKAGERPAPPR